MTKFKVVDVKKGKDGNDIPILVPADRDPRKCKSCGKNDRKQGSSRCEDCANKFARQKVNDDRLARKIARNSIN